jgi:hypothetical protein
MEVRYGTLGGEWIVMSLLSIGKIEALAKERLPAIPGRGIRVYFCIVFMRH